MNKKPFALFAVVIVALLAIVLLSGAFYTVAENEYACVMRFSKIEKTVSDAGLYLKIPFIDEIHSFPQTVLLYDIPPSEVLTADKKNMTVDSYVLWKIADPLTFYQTLGTISEAQLRINAITYTSLKNLLSTLQQNDIINEDDASERNDIYASITTEVDALSDQYGIDIIDIKIKRFDLPYDNEQAVYERMISDRNQIADKYTADGQYEASIIRNNVDKQVNILISNAEAKAAELEAEGEQEYMKRLAEAYDTADKKDFFEFQMAIDALKDTLNSSDKVVILDGDSKLGQMLIDVAS